MEYYVQFGILNMIYYNLILFFGLIFAGYGCKKKNSHNLSENKPFSAKESKTQKFDSSNAQNVDNQNKNSDTSEDFSKLEIELPSDQNFLNDKENTIKNEKLQKEISVGIPKSNLEPLKNKKTVGSTPKNKTTSKSLNGISFFLKGKLAMIRGEKQRAKKLYLKACGLSHFESCNSYGYILLKQNNLENAKNFFKVGCENGVPKSCNNLGWTLEKLSDDYNAKNYYSWSCLYSHKKGCKNLLRVEKKLKKLNSKVGH